jgi:uncharacterized membrane protein YdbT with pleckstrin-like domain
MKHMADKPAAPNEAQRRSSHVTIAPQSHPDGNFDPQIRTQYANEPKVVHATRQPEAHSMQPSQRDKQLHDASVARYPRLNLSDGEFVILDVKRHPIGLFLPIFSTSVTLLAIMALLILYPSDTSSSVGMALPSYGLILLLSMVAMVGIGIGGAVAVWVYLQNHFFMTNESIIQEIQHSLFSRHEQTVSLGSIEDASFRQSGLMQTMFNYGTVRLSTEGEETTYQFSYVADPRSHVAKLNNAVEAFKNGRAVDPNDT